MLIIALFFFFPSTRDYRHSDYVYFETSSSSPYQIRRIEELNKTPSGNVEAKVMCFYRRRDLPTPLVQLADKHQSEYKKVNLMVVLCRFRKFLIKIWGWISWNGNLKSWNSRNPSIFHSSMLFNHKSFI